MNVEVSVALGRADVGVDGDGQPADLGQLVRHTLRLGGARKCNVRVTVFFQR